LNPPPQPVIFEPIFRPKPWGGRKLESFFKKPLPPAEMIGESWELASLPGAESRVRSGPLAGRTVADLVEMWGRGLYGRAELINGRFPWLIKFLDARERLSVQVHARPHASPPGALQPGVKHEAWYVLAAEPGAELFIGVKPGTRLRDLARAAETGRVAQHLRSWPAQAGAAFFLPSGVVHALGAGLLVAEIQTPGDTTYRLSDWGRVDGTGRPRELHIRLALQNARLDVEPEVIQPSRRPRLSDITGETLASCPWFRIDRASILNGADLFMGPGRMMVWVVLSGWGDISDGANLIRFVAGDVVLVPSARSTRITCIEQCELLRITAPAEEHE
jgi:mannose-6-phosphate isomerase